jgi:hypothetical protein
MAKKKDAAEPTVEEALENMKAAEGEEKIAAAREEYKAAKVRAREEDAKARREADAKLGITTVVVSEAPMNPIVGYVHGRGEVRFEVGEEARIPVEFLPCLDDMNAKYEEV